MYVYNRKLQNRTLYEVVKEDLKSTVELNEDEKLEKICNAIEVYFEYNFERKSNK